MITLLVFYALTALLVAGWAGLNYYRNRDKTDEELFPDMIHPDRYTRSLTDLNRERAPKKLTRAAEWGIIGFTVLLVAWVGLAHLDRIRAAIGEFAPRSRNEMKATIRQTKP